MAISTAEMGKEGPGGSTLLKVYGDSGECMEILYASDLNLVLELTVGSVLGPWYIARNIHMVSGSPDTDLRILRAVKHFRQHVGVPSLMLKTVQGSWNLFRQIWDFLEVDEPLA